MKFQQTQKLADIAAAGVYLNFRINKTALIKETLQQIYNEKEQYGCTSEGKGKRVSYCYLSFMALNPFSR